MTNPNQTHYWRLSLIPYLASPNLKLAEWWCCISSSLGGIFSLSETFKMFHTAQHYSCLQSSSTFSLLALKKSKAWGWQVHYTWTPHPFMNVGELSPPSGESKLHTTSTWFSLDGFESFNCFCNSQWDFENSHRWSQTSLREKTLMLFLQPLILR